MSRVLRGSLFAILVVVLFCVAPTVLMYFCFEYNSFNIILIEIALKVCVMIVPCMLYLYIFRNDIDIKCCLKLNKLSIKQIVLLTFLGLLLQPIAMFIASITSLFTNNVVADYMNNLKDTSFLLILTAMAVLPAITEEIMMRGIILYEARELNLRIAIVLNGVLFGILHRNLSQFFYAVILGIIFSYIVIITNSIYSTILIHFIINGTQLVLQRWIATTSDPVTKDISVLDKSSAIGITFVMLTICTPIILAIIKKLKSTAN